MHNSQQIVNFAFLKTVVMKTESKRPTGKASRSGFWRRAADLYVDGFRSMTLGKTLWAIIAVKLAIMFLVLKLFFFPDFLKSKSDNAAGKAQYVRSQLIERGHGSDEKPRQATPHKQRNN